jgi:hypothetical protein
MRRCTLSGLSAKPLWNAEPYLGDDAFPSTGWQVAWPVRMVLPSRKLSGVRQLFAASCEPLGWPAVGALKVQPGVWNIPRCRARPWWPSASNSLPRLAERPDEDRLFLNDTLLQGHQPRKYGGAAAEVEGNS